MGLFNFSSRKQNSTIAEKTYISEKSDKKKYSGFIPSEEQMQAFKALNSSSDSFFVTGRAGTGKSALLSYFVENTSKKCVIVAPTGIAAINVGGDTIHSFFSLDPHAQNPDNEEQLNMSANQKELLSSFQTLIIDEVSMVRSDIMDMIDAKLKKARGNIAPFGGCQVIAFGDLYQLPPFSGDEEISKYIYDKHHSEYFFAAPVFKSNPLKIIELQEVHRQSDKKFIDILNRVRIGENTSDVLDVLNARCIEPSSEIQYITLVPSNEAAHMINMQSLSRIQEKEHVFRGELSGQFSQKEAPTDINLTLKVGARIMMLKNDPGDRWHNGSTGIVVGIEEPNLVRVRIDSLDDASKGYIYEIGRETWAKYKYKYDSSKHSIQQEQIGSFTQFPLRLAYAITIHKSQGKTYDRVKVDYSNNRAFAAGQTYVALSRCRSFEGLYLSKPLLSSDIKVNPEVVRFMSGKAIRDATDESMFTSAGIYDNDSSSDLEIEWMSGQRIKAPLPDNPKKITGTRFAAILGADPYNTPFSTWCSIMNVYEKPFEENQYTITGRVVEPKQYSFVSEKLNGGFRAISPEERFGENAKETTKYNFFDEDNEVFGGMWDYLLERNNKCVAVFEMKTTNIKNAQKWRQKIPDNVKLQAALYAYLLDVEDYYIVASFIREEDYDHPENYVCTDNNTIIQRFNLKRDYIDFESNCIQRVLQWWNQHVITGISPPYDNFRDRAILSELRTNSSHPFSQ